MTAHKKLASPTRLRMHKDDARRIYGTSDAAVLEMFLREVAQAESGDTPGVLVEAEGDSITIVYLF